MADEKWPYHIAFRDDEDRIQYFLTVVFEGSRKPPPEYSAGVLIKSIERLKTSMDRNLVGLKDLKMSTDANLKGIEVLRASTEASSHEANHLSASIKKLTAWLVGLTVTAVLLAVISLVVLWTSAQ